MNASIPFKYSERHMFPAIIVSILLILHSNGIDIPFSIVDILIGIPQSKKLFSIKDTICSMLLLNAPKHWS